MSYIGMFSIKKGFEYAKSLTRYTSTLKKIREPEIKRQVYKPSEEVREEKYITKEVISNIQKQIANKNHGRLFAIVHILGKQFKITTEDIIIIEGYWPPTVGDRLRLEKVLLVGGTDFSIIGRPLLSEEQVCVEATVIEKTLSHTKTVFKKIKRKQYMRINFHKIPYTVLRINEIGVNAIEETQDCQGLEGKIF